METIVGVGLPLLLLLAYELWARSKDLTANEYREYLVSKEQKRINALEVNPEELLETKRQNRFGLQVIAGALLFTAVMLFILSVLTTSGTVITAGVATAVLFSALIPFLASRKVELIIEQNQADPVA
jgi:SSS family solute:Na+ symporter